MRFGHVLDTAEYRSEGQRRQEEENRQLALRREKAVIAMVGAAERFLSDTQGADEIVENRADLIQKSRVSHAEAYAVLAEKTGDFTSMLEYFEAWSEEPRRSTSLWHGFVLRDACVDLSSGNVRMICRKTSRGGFVIVFRGDTRAVAGSCDRDDIDLRGMTLEALSKTVWDDFCENAPYGDMPHVFGVALQEFSK